MRILFVLTHFEFEGQKYYSAMWQLNEINKCVIVCVILCTYTRGNPFRKLNDCLIIAKNVIEKIQFYKQYI